MLEAAQFLLPLGMLQVKLELTGCRVRPRCSREQTRARRRVGEAAGSQHHFASVGTVFGVPYGYKSYPLLWEGRQGQARGKVTRNSFQATTQLRLPGVQYVGLQGTRSVIARAAPKLKRLVALGRE